MKTPGFCFHLDALNTFWKRSFPKQWYHDIHVIFCDRVFLKHKSKVTGDCCGFQFLRCNVDGKHLMRLKSKASISKLLWRSVNRA